MNSDSGQHLRETFARQFESDGTGFLYRRFERGPAYRVSAAERDAFIADFDRSQRILFGLTIGLLLAMLAVLIAIGGDPDKGWGPVEVIAAIAILLIVFLVFYMRSFTAPAKALAQRTPAAVALSPQLQRRLALDRLTWRKLATAAAIVIVAPFWASHGHPFDGWNRLWIVLAVAALIFVAVQAVRKWRFDREG